MKLKKGVQYYWFQWGSEGCGNVTVWHADGDTVTIDGRMAQAKALKLGATFDCPFP